MEDAEMYAALVRQFHKLDAWLREHRRTSEPLPGSRHALDDAAADPFYVSAACHHALTHALDHLVCLRSTVVKAEDVPMVAPFTLMRATIENAATAVWLMQPADRSERVLRRLQLQLHDLKDTSDMAALGFTMTGPSTEQMRQKIADVAEAAGWPRDRLSGKSPSLGRIVHEAGTSHPRGSKHVAGEWRLCSGFTHGRSWAMASGLEREHVRERSVGVWDVDMRAPISRILAVTMTARQLLQEGLHLHGRHRLVWPSASG